mmetsp:Transcript_7244/g.29202  ORF Transcript_7244/g.29202 Transcript_7244/m.29202 type:complete len:347 (+) Transcript_7244:82-1122(+)
MLFELANALLFVAIDQIVHAPELQSILKVPDRGRARGPGVVRVPLNIPNRPTMAAVLKDQVRRTSFCLFRTLFSADFRVIKHVHAAYFVGCHENPLCLRVHVHAQNTVGVVVERVHCLVRAIGQRSTIPNLNGGVFSTSNDDVLFERAPRDAVHVVRVRPLREPRRLLRSRVPKKHIPIIPDRAQLPLVPWVKAHILDRIGVPRKLDARPNRRVSREFRRAQPAAHHGRAASLLLLLSSRPAPRARISELPNHHLFILTSTRHHLSHRRHRQRVFRVFRVSSQARRRRRVLRPVCSLTRALLPSRPVRVEHEHLRRIRVRQQHVFFPRHAPHSIHLSRVPQRLFLL